MKNLKATILATALVSALAYSGHANAEPASTSTTRANRPPLAQQTTASAADPMAGETTSPTVSPANSSRSHMGKNKSTETNERNETRAIVKDSAQAYRNVAGANNSNISKNVLAEARCIAVFPEVTTAALVVGGRHGDGVVTCRAANGQWSDVGFLDLSGGSLGVQLGAKKTGIVLYLLSDAAKEKLTKGEFTLGADASYALGEKGADKSIDTSKNQVVAYCDESGAFAGAALQGTVLREDTDDAQQYYGRKVNLTNLLGSTSAQRPATINQLINELPKESVRTN